MIAKHLFFSLAKMTKTHVRKDIYNTGQVLLFWMQSWSSSIRSTFLVLKNSAATTIKLTRFIKIIKKKSVIRNPAKNFRSSFIGL